MRRLPRNILLGLAILLIVIVAATQVVLWTDYPRKLVLSLVQEELGLRVEARSLSTGWFGATTLSDVKLSLPLAEESFLDVPSLRVKHTWLVPLLLTQNFHLKALELNKPTVVVRRDAGGKWNLQNVAELLGKAGGGTPAPGTDTQPPDLPALRVTDGTVIVVEHDGRKATIAPVNVTGKPEGMLVYRYDATAADAVKLVGEVAPGDDWKHALKLDARPRAEWLKLWVPEPEEMSAKIEWTGSVSDSGANNNGTTGGSALTGRAVIEQATYGNKSVKGTVAVLAGSGPTVIRPTQLTVTTGVATFPEATLANGTITINGPSFQLADVHLSAMNGEAQVNGAVNIADQTANLHAEWQDLAGPSEMVHGGRLDLKVQSPFPGRPEIAVVIDSTGQISRGAWDGHVRVNGAGRSWTDIDWTASVDRFDWTGRFPVQVRDLVATATQTDTMVRLTSLRCPAVQKLDAIAQLNWADSKWLVQVSGQNPVRETGVPVEFSLIANGDWKEVRVNDLFVHTAGTQVRLSGDLIRDRPKPLVLNLSVIRLPHPVRAMPNLDVRGRLMADGKLAGTLDPLRLDFEGNLRTNDFAILQRDIGNIRGEATGTITRDKTEFAVRNMRLLKGAWQIDGQWPWTDDAQTTATQPSKARPTGSDVLRITIAGAGVSLKEVGELLRTPAMSGSANTNVTIDIPFPAPNANTITCTGRIDASDFAMKGVDAQQVVGQFSLANGIFKADPITLYKTEGTTNGKTTLTYTTPLDGQSPPAATLAAESWPVRVSEAATAITTANATLSLDIPNRGATGSFGARASVATTQRSIVEVQIGGAMNGQVATIDTIQCAGVGGSATGKAVLHLGTPNLSTVQLDWTDVQGKNLGNLLPALGDLEGAYSGTLQLGPSDAPRALEPMRAKVELRPQAGRFRSIDIGPAKLSAFINLNAQFGIERIVLDELPSEHLARQAGWRDPSLPTTRPTTAATAPTTTGPSTTAATAPATQLALRPLEWNELRLADGRVKLWARHGKHPSGEMQTHVIANFEQLDIEQIVHAFVQDKKPLPGRLAGKTIVFGDPAQLDLMIGQGHLDVTDSDLANTVALSTLYDALRLGSPPPTPIGQGSLDLRMEQSTLTLQNMRYFNRGVEARAASISIQDIWAIPNSPIDGYLVGTARPFKDLKLPFMADVDSILTVLQSTLTTVKIEGTVKNARARVVPFSEVGDALRRLLVGDVKTETNQK